jgi:maleylpyruvate isomerase
VTTTADVRAATESLLADIVTLTDADARAASLLYGWSRGHLLTHLARSADAMGNLVTAARTGVSRPAYASPEARAADIEAGSARPPAELLADLATSSETLLTAIDDLPEESLSFAIRLGSREFTASTLAFLRLREVLVHHVDLGLSYRTSDWPASFVLAMLDDLAPVLTNAGPGTLASTDLDRTWTLGDGPTLTGNASDVLAWVVGRAPTGPLEVSDGSALPPGPVWI